MRWIIAAAFLIAAGSAQAQTPSTATPPTAPAPAATPASPPVMQSAPPSAAPAANAPRTSRRHMTRQQRFDAANTTHDGHLTEEQARSGMPSIARNFAAIDTAKKGYVTMDDIKAYYAARRSAAAATKKTN